MSIRDDMAHKFVNECPKYSGYPAHEETYRTAWDAALKHAPEVLALVEALELISAKKVLCVFGSPNMGNSPHEAFREGSNVAFGQSAEVADDALTHWKESATKKREE